MNRSEELEMHPQIDEAVGSIQRLVHPPTAAVARLHLQAMIAASREDRRRRSTRLAVRILAAAAFALGAGALALPGAGQGDGQRNRPAVDRPEGVSEGRAAGGVPVATGVATATRAGRQAQDGAENTHGRIVSAIAQAAEPGPGHGALVSRVASGNSEDHRMDAAHRGRPHASRATTHGKTRGKGGNANPRG